MARAARAALLALVSVAAVAVVPTATGAAATSPSPSTTPAPDSHASEPWWAPLGERGTRLARVTESGGRITVTTDSGAVLDSTDGGRTFAPSVAPPPPLPPAGADVRSGEDRWRIDAGAVVHSRGAGPAARDPGSPDLGAGARLLAAPSAAPGVVVAVSEHGVVYRRTSAGSWGASLVLLPRSLVGGIPAVTDLTAFSGPSPGGVSATVYMATDGYSVLATSDGGDSWFRDDPGLPGDVLGLAAAEDLSAVYAATSDGLWVHHLRVPPSVPVYPAPDLAARQVWITAITLGACATGGFGLWLALRLGPARRRDTDAQGTA